MENLIELTEKEQALLKNIAYLMCEDGLSEYTTNDIADESEKGVLGSLIKKELVYDCYDDDGGEVGGMYCLSLKGEQESLKRGYKMDFVTYGREIGESAK